MAEITKERVEKALAKIRPYLKADAGDIEFVNIKNGDIVEVRMLGSCVGCPLSQMTLRAGVERAIMHDIPEVKRVEAVV